MSSKKKKTYVYLGKVIFITLLIVLFIRCFFIESFTVQSLQMESSLYKGDKILIDKTAYGIRLPLTLFSIPFTFDSIFGGKSYSSIVQMPYKRLFESNIKRNDVVVFNNPVETDKPLDKRSLLVSRCVALPGDTVGFRQNALSVNGELYVSSPNQIKEYIFAKHDQGTILELLDKLDFPVRNMTDRNDSILIQLSRFEAFISNESLPYPLLSEYKASGKQDYQLVIPFRGKIVELNERNITIYEQIIREEQTGKDVTIRDGYLFIDGLQSNDYEFTDNYYWVLSDNIENLSDSRTIGFVPFRSIMGKARYIWQSQNKMIRFSPVE